LAEQGLAQEAVAEYQKLLRLRPDWPEVLNNLAWTLATHPTASLRDGVQAEQLARRACALTSYTNCPMLQTLAAAQAE
jgi:Flp pilus assembly protein TadD